MHIFSPVIFCSKRFLLIPKFCQDLHRPASAMTTKAAVVLAPVSFVQPAQQPSVRAALWALFSRVLWQKKTDCLHHPLCLTQKPRLLKSTQTRRWPTVPTAPRCVARSNTMATGGKSSSIYFPFCHYNCFSSSQASLLDHKWPLL